jgi:AmmeMemoRadiSam system protein B
MWYSGSAKKLSAAIDRHLATEPPDFIPANLLGLVVPHAGHRFSGHVAGSGFGYLKPDAFDTVILLGPDHRGAAPGRTSTPAADLWRTPLGDIPVAWELLDPLRKELSLAVVDDDDEHSLEIELPFLQKKLETFRLVPLMMGSQSLQTCQQLSAGLVRALQQNGRHALFVASSDLSHFFDDDTARRLDTETIAYVLNMDARGLIEHVASGRLHGQPLACGAGPIATVILATRALGAVQAHKLKYATSADVYPDRSRVVGYAAIGFTR